MYKVANHLIEKANNKKGKGVVRGQTPILSQWYTCEPKDTRKYVWAYRYYPLLGTTGLGFPIRVGRIYLVMSKHYESLV